MAEQQSVKDQAEEAGARAANMVDKMRNSSYGKKIPLEINNVGLKTLLRMTLIAKLGYIAPAYLLVTLTASPYNFLSYIVNFIKGVYVAIALIDITIEICISMSKMKSLYIVIIASLIIKNASLLLITLCYVLSSPSILCFLMWIGFIVPTIIVDGLFAYYVGIYFNDLPDEVEGEVESDIKRTQEDIAAQI
ncbi:hypothetical protein PAEPH01_0261 [Pancytospora epiphaga]|nr:hypothetical protein PAEPH01_0261 [Pancytospora epiphaga]